MKSKQHVLVELKQFIQAVGNHRGHPSKLTAPSVVRGGINLLHDLPAAREIVFEYFASVAEVAVQNYVATANIDLQTGLPLQPQLPTRDGGNGNNQQPSLEDNNCFAPIQETLEGLVSKGPTSWGPVLASWSLDLVGRLSDKYTKRSMSIGAACNFWLNCAAMRGLVMLISFCFRRLNATDTESCVQSLLGSFQRYNLSFDWVVARLGGCFPFKIMSQILQISLKRFVEDFCTRLDSEVGILDYLSFANEQELKVALREMLQDGLQPKKTIDAAIVPFLLGLSNYSEELLQILISVFLEIYNDDLRAAIIQKSPLWMSNKLFADMQPSLNNIALRLKSHGTTLLMAAARLADQYSWCQDFLEFTLQELEQVVLNAHVCPLMDDLATEETKYMLWKSCLSACDYEQQTAVRLLLIVSTQHSHIYYQTIAELLRKPNDLNQSGLGVIIRMVSGQSGVVEFPDVKPGLQMLLEDVLLQEQFENSRLALPSVQSESLNTFRNLDSLVKMQKKSSFPYMKQQLLMTALNDCTPKILHILEVILTKLLLRISKEAEERSAAKLKAAQRNNRHHYNVTADYYARKKLRGRNGGAAVQTNITDWKPSCSTKTADPDVDIKMEVVTEGNVGEEEEEDESSVRHAKRLILAHTIVDLLISMEAGSKAQVMRTTEVLKLSVLTAKYFFIALTEKCASVRAAAVNRTLTLFQRQCSARKAARTACLRELIEGALFYHGHFFGQYEESDVDELKIPVSEMVLLQNQRQSVGPNTNRTVLHAGVIGRGLRPENALGAGDECGAEIQTYLLKALDACCADADGQNVIEGYSMISLLLVEMVSTDVMYNGLPFPDEEFTRVTMERDLMIRRAFVISPILWSLLGFIATHRPALCFSSVLLRALCATCLHQWRAKNVSKFKPYDQKEELMQCTKKLLKILAVGQLLPPPLSNLHVIIEYFEAPEIALLLKECVWNYLKDHVPSPALFHVDGNGLHWRNPAMSKILPQYVDTLRNLMQKKLTTLGPYYHQMFIMSELNAPANPIKVETTFDAKEQ